MARRKSKPIASLPKLPEIRGARPPRLQGDPVRVLEKKTLLDESIRDMRVGVSKVIGRFSKARKV